MVNKGHNDMENQRQFQQRIRQDAAERNDALQGLSTWMGTLKNAKPTQAAEGSYVCIKLRMEGWQL